MNTIQHAFTVCDLAGDKFHALVYKYDREGDFQDGHPLRQVERCDLEYSLLEGTKQKRGIEK